MMRTRFQTCPCTDPERLPVVLQAQLVGDASLSDTPIAPKQEAHFSKESISPGIPPRPKNHRTGNSFSQARERQNDLQEHCGSWDNDDSSLSSLEFKEFKLVDGVLAPDRISFVFQCAPCQDSTRQNPGGHAIFLKTHLPERIWGVALSVAYAAIGPPPVSSSRSFYNWLQTPLRLYDRCPPRASSHVTSFISDLI